ncbi:MAG: GAF domain-containing protein [Chloroflexi bacterium]|nr:GAF domain-containing protein [Chloroflexota bacterium]
MAHDNSGAPPATYEAYNEYLSALHDTALALMNRLDLDGVLEAVVTRAARLAGTDHGYIYLETADRSMIEMKVGIGRHAENLQTRLHHDEGLTGHVWQTGQPAIIDDYRSWEGHVKRLKTLDFGAVVAVPLTSSDRIVGVLGVSYETPRQVDLGDIATMLVHFAKLASIAIDNARLYTAAQQEVAERRRAEEALRASEHQLRELYVTTRRQAQELHLMDQVRTALSRQMDLQSIFRTIVETIAATFGYTQVSLYLREGDTMVLQHQVGYERMLERIPLSQGIIGRTVRSGRPALITDVRHDRDYLGAIDGVVSEICVPLTLQQRVIGALNVESTNGVTLTSADLYLINSLVEQLNIAIERAHLYEELQHRVEQLDALHDTMAAITRHLDLDTVLRAILEREVKLMRANCGELGLYDPERNDLRIQLSFNMGRDYAGTRLAPGEGIMGQVALTRAPLVVANYHQWEACSHIYDDLPPATLVAVPLLAGDELIGVIGAGDWNLERVFTEDDVRLLTLFAQQATIAIQNARLFAEAQYLATTDPLMGINNRRQFFNLARREYERAQRHNRPLAAMLFDIDDFKRVNDTYGHTVGDTVMQAVGGICRDELRTGDVSGRYGGEEIIALLPDTDCSGAFQVAERLRLRLTSISVRAGDQELRITASFGIAASKSGNLTLDTLIERADQALLRAKRLGKNRIETWPEGCDSGDAVPQQAAQSLPMA